MKKRACYIIAEAGVNHNGSLDVAKELIDVAATSGVDAVKFQTFKAEKLVTATASKAHYQEKTCGTTEGQFEMLKRLELDVSAHVELLEYSKFKGIQFLSTAFDVDSLAVLDDLGLPLFKIPSGEITNYPLLAATAALGKPIVLSTGMADLKDIAAALKVLYKYGAAQEDITVLHCTTAYPTPVEEVNLSAMRTIGKAFPEIAVGYSDHTLGITIPVAAVALGAGLIEKHFTLDRKMEGPDHRASLEPDELKQMVIAIRDVERAMGDGLKQPSRTEKNNFEAARKSIVATCRINKGEIFTVDNISAKRPGTGLSPMKWPSVIGTVAKRSFEADEMIEL